jgi:hypothetical protein
MVRSSSVFKTHTKPLNKYNSYTTFIIGDQQGASLLYLDIKLYWGSATAQEVLCNTDSTENNI